MAEERAQLQGAALTTPTFAAIASSADFGLWHIAPTAVSLELNGIAAGSPEGMTAIAAGVAVTTAAALVFTWLRRGSDSLLAPVLAHWASNALGLLAAATSRSPREFVAGRSDARGFRTPTPVGDDGRMSIPPAWNPCPLRL